MGLSSTWNDKMEGGKSRSRRRSLGTAKRSNEALWQRIKSNVQAEEIGGTKAGQWSARKALIAVKRYKDAGGRYAGKKSASNSLRRWVKQDWRTKSGRPSHITGERYLPSRAFSSLSRGELASINRSKRRAMKQGRQYSRMSKRIASKVRKFRD
jgi:hypothetical protein